MHLTGSVQGVIEGHFCTIQGVLKQFGEVGVALWYDVLAWKTVCHLLVSVAQLSEFISAVLFYLTETFQTIAIHTFATIVLRWKEPKGFTLPLVVLGFIVVFLMLVVGLGYAAHRDSDYFGNTKYCLFS